MKAPRMIYETNLEKLKSLGLLNVKSHVKIKNDPYMPLCVEWVGKNQLSIAHYYEQNGDLMADPEMTLEIHPDLNMVEVLTYTQHGLGIFKEVYTYDDNGKKLGVKLNMKRELNNFLGMWLKNLKDQGFKYEST